MRGISKFFFAIALLLSAAWTSSNASAQGGYWVNPAPPRTIIIRGAYPSRTILNNATRGGVIEYTHQGNGYVYSPGSSYPTVISSGPSIYPSTTVISPSDPPVIIETEPAGRPAAAGRPVVNKGEIRLIFPQEATDSLAYRLNGTLYSIKPGYQQTFVEDRNWIIEFSQFGIQNSLRRYRLTAGTYLFSYNENGWDLRQAPMIPPVIAPLTIPRPAPAQVPKPVPARAAPTPKPTPIPPPVAPPVAAPVPAPDL